MNDRDTDTDAPALTAHYVLGRTWMVEAPCAYSPDPDAWFPDGDTADTTASVEAVDVCRLRCPVWVECAAYAIATEQSDGIHGGIALNGRRGLDEAAARLRRHLGGSDLQPDLVDLFDGLADARKRRRQPTSHPQRARLAQPQRLRDLLAECAPVRPSDGREAA